MRWFIAEVPVLRLWDVNWSVKGCLVQVLIYSPDGRCLFKYSAYESGLGVKSVGWSPCGQFLAVGSYDQAVRTLNHLTWKTFAEFTHAASIRGPCNAAIFKVNLLFLPLITVLADLLLFLGVILSIFTLLMSMPFDYNNNICHWSKKKCHRKWMIHGSLICQSYA